MGKNTPDRQKFIIDNLKIELLDIDGEDLEETEEEGVPKKKAVLTE